MQVFFCENCSSAVNDVELSRGEGRQVGDDVWCKNCIALAPAPPPRPGRSKTGRIRIRPARRSAPARQAPPGVDVPREILDEIANAPPPPAPDPDPAEIRTQRIKMAMLAVPAVVVIGMALLFIMGGDEQPGPSRTARTAKTKTSRRAAGGAGKTKTPAPAPAPAPPKDPESKWIGMQPSDVTVREGERAVFRIVIVTMGGKLRWQRDLKDIENAISPNLILSSVRASDDGAKFRCIVTKSRKRYYSRGVTLTVIGKSVPPRLASAAASAKEQTVRVTFTQKIHPDAAGRAENFLIDGGVRVLSATPDPAGTGVVLKTSGIRNGQTYELTVHGVRNAGSAAAVIAKRHGAVGFTAVADLPGLSAAYYRNKDFQGVPVRRVDPRVDFDWKQGSPLPGLPRDNFSIRWQGFLTPSASGEYVFSFRADDGFRFWLDGKILIDVNRHEGRDHLARASLTAGRDHPLKIEFFEQGGDAHLRMDWQHPSFGRQRVPAKAFSHDPVQ